MWIFDTSNENCARIARREFVERLRAHAGEGDYFDAEVVFGELLANVVRHAPGIVNVWLDCDDREARLYVHDYGPGCLTSRPFPGGLKLARTLSDEIQINRIPVHGTEVIAVLPIQKRISGESRKPSAS